MSDFDGTLNPSAGWPDVPQASDVMRLLGGEGGPLNAQAEALAARTNMLRAEVMESLRRSYAEAGYNVVGTFRAGFTIVNANDVGIDETTGKGFTGPAGEVVAGTDPASGGFVDRSNSLLRSKNDSAHFSTDDRTGYQRTFHLIGDSHTYGQGSRGDYGPFALKTHSTRYGATTWSTLLRDALMSAWRTSLPHFHPTISSDAMTANRVTGARNLMGGGSQSSVGYAHNTPALFSQSERFNNIDLARFNYNTLQGFYQPVVKYFTYSVDTLNSIAGATVYTFTPDNMPEYDVNGRYGSFSGVTCIDGTVRTRAFVTVPAAPSGVVKGQPFYLRVCGGTYTGTSFRKWTQVLCEDVRTVSGLTMLAFSVPNGGTPTKTSLDGVYAGGATSEVAAALAPKLEVPIDSPTALVGIDFITGYGGADVYLGLAPLDSHNTATGYQNAIIGDWYYSASFIDNQTYTIRALTKTSDSAMVDISNGAMFNWSGAKQSGVVLTVNTSTYLPNSVSASFSDFPMWLYFGVRVTGILTVKVAKISKYTESSVGFHFGVRGVMATDMTKICTHGFGCHSVGDLIGRTADICNHDAGVAFDHVPYIKKCEELSSKNRRFVVMQAPIVNEYLRQTSIAQYKSDLTAFYNSMYDGAPDASTAKQFIIFTGAGEKGKDPYLGPVTGGSSITYQMYRDATREWAESMGVLYIDAAAKQKELIDHGRAVANDFLMKDTNYDSNHPNNYTQRLWYEEVSKVVLRVFQ